MNDEVLILEDDYLTRDDARGLFGRYFPQLKVNFARTEHEFRTAFPALEKSPPRLVLLDMRVMWAYPAEEMPEPAEDVIAETFSRAGLRCWKMIRGNQNTSRVPVIFWSVLDERANVGKEVLDDPLTAFVEKDTRDSEILFEIRSALRKS